VDGSGKVWAGGWSLSSENGRVFREMACLSRLSVSFENGLALWLSLLDGLCGLACRVLAVASCLFESNGLRLDFACACLALLNVVETLS